MGKQNRLLSNISLTSAGLTRIADKGRLARKCCCKEVREEEDADLYKLLKSIGSKRRCH